MMADSPKRIRRAHVGCVAFVVAGIAAPSARMNAQQPSQAYYAYVASESQDQVAVVRFDGAGLSVVKRITVGRFPDDIEGPHGIAVSGDGQYWYTSIAHGRPYGHLDKYLTGVDTLVGSTELDMFPSTVSLDPSGTFAFVANSNFDGDMVPKPVSVVFTPKMTLVGHVETCTMPHGSRVNSAGTMQYSGCMMDDQAVEIDTRTFQVSRRFGLATGKERLLAAADAHAMHNMTAAQMPAPTCSPTWAQPSPDDKLLYVACNRAKIILEIDLASGAVTRRLATPPGPYNLDFSLDGNTMVVTQKSNGTVTIWNRPAGTMLAELKTGRRLAHGVAITPDGRYAFVTSEGLNSEPGSVDVIDIARRAIVAHADVGKQAGGVAFWKMESN